MGPRLISRGTAASAVLSPTASRASMGPRLISRGTEGVRALRIIGYPLQWGRD